MLLLNLRLFAVLPAVILAMICFEICMFFVFGFISKAAFAHGTSNSLNVVVDNFKDVTSKKYKLKKKLIETTDLNLDIVLAPINKLINLLTPMAISSAASLKLSDNSSKSIEERGEILSLLENPDYCQFSKNIDLYKVDIEKLMAELYMKKIQITAHIKCKLRQ